MSWLRYRPREGLPLEGPGGHVPDEYAGHGSLGRSTPVGWRYLRLLELLKGRGSQCQKDTGRDTLRTRDIRLITLCSVSKLACRFLNMRPCLCVPAHAVGNHHSVIVTPFYFPPHPPHTTSIVPDQGKVYGISSRESHSITLQVPCHCRWWLRNQEVSLPERGPGCHSPLRDPPRALVRGV